MRGFKFHPTVQGFDPSDEAHYPLYAAIQDAGVPALFHTGQTGIGAGLPGGRGLRLGLSNPILLDPVAADFPDLQIIMAHPSVPWQDEALSVATHKHNTWIDLSGWSPKYFPAELVRYANSLLKTPGAVRLRLPAAHPGPLDPGRRADRAQARGHARDHEAQRRPPARPRADRPPTSRSTHDNHRRLRRHRRSRRHRPRIHRLARDHAGSREPLRRRRRTTTSGSTSTPSGRHPAPSAPRSPTDSSRSRSRPSSGPTCSRSKASRRRSTTGSTRCASSRR